MWRLPRKAYFQLFGFRLVSTPTTDKPQWEKYEQQQQQQTAHPIIFNVPALSRVVGRDVEILSLWQNLLAGRRFQAITGPDGIGKSTIAAEFCDRARRSERFTCIHWFNAKDDLQSTLLQFFQSMKGRKEKDVLLVIDGVQDPQEVLRLIPEHTNVYTLLTTVSEVDSSNKIGVLKVLPLSPSAVLEFPHVLEVEDESSPAREVMHAVGYVPLLMHMVCCLMESETVTPMKLKEELHAKGFTGEGILSISSLLDVLLNIALAALEQDCPGGKEYLAKLALFNIDNISYTLVDCLLGEGEGEVFAVQAAGLGICEQRWDEASLRIHPSIAKILRSKADSASVEESAKVLHSLWPRRWRGTGSSIANELVLHTRAICETVDKLQLKYSDDLLQCLDRSATFLALNEGKELVTAAELWLRVVRSNQENGKKDAETVRHARECGRLLHFLRDDRAGKVLQYAFNLACAVHGEQSIERALILGCYAPYMHATEDAVCLLRDAAALLENRVSSVESVLGKEEERMLSESVFVLLLREGQMLQELGKAVPEVLWTMLQQQEERIKKGRQLTPSRK
ncbi:uncharacterized protein TM35_000142910 [Trypanosoma theileri]|uniref:NB-ARC domain-containing protein n=1 Tax=Trypanosoma theileri TaxID=67003 RepID=A0A1X0NY36_9TRYP|nr:uncharacterized protein TM35_000142910 [Trypanosoma theileri]ORC89080.1 hypothetical protein TM35_000142910 [Trypanosoma theileri]